MGPRIDPVAADRLELARWDGILVQPYHDPVYGPDGPVPTGGYEATAAERRRWREFCRLMDQERRLAVQACPCPADMRGRPPQRFEITLAAPPGRRFPPWIPPLLAAQVPVPTDIRVRAGGRRIRLELDGFRRIFPMVDRLTTLAAEHLEPLSPTRTPTGRARMAPAASGRRNLQG
jgi:hypothetical protein